MLCSCFRVRSRWSYLSAKKQLEQQTVQDEEWTMRHCQVLDTGYKGMEGWLSSGYGTSVAVLLQRHLTSPVVAASSSDSRKRDVSYKRPSGMTLSYILKAVEPGTKQIPSTPEVIMSPLGSSISLVVSLPLTDSTHSARSQRCVTLPSNPPLECTAIA